ncbi:MAG: hypothetical protein IK144_09725 [Bacteroidaceae bacterium]|nr:hypothetical protein [Bacteroidaceae bacterium]
MRKQLLFWIFMLIASGGIAQTMQGYEYWFDNDYDSRITAEGSLQKVSLDIDIGNVNSGLHYLNFRAQGDDGKWGGLSRYIVYLGTKSTQYEYWMDNDYDHRTLVNEAPSPMFNVDISGLSHGLHYFNFRSRNSGDRWGSLSRYIVYIGIESMQYEYWMDNDYAHRTVVYDVPSSILSVDISKLSPGLHYFNFRTRYKGNQWGSLARYMVYVNNHLNRLSSLNYWIDDNVDDVQTVKVTDNVVMVSYDISELTRGSHKLSYQGITAGGRFVIQEDQYFEAIDWDDAISAPSADTLTDEGSCIYDLQGCKLAAPQKGINIIRYSDGTSKKVLIK